jgi:hypothetical protein
VQDDSQNGTGVFRYKNQWLELCVTPKQEIIMVKGATVMETI